MDALAPPIVIVENFFNTNVLMDVRGVYLELVVHHTTNNIQDSEDYGHAWLDCGRICANRIPNPNITFNKSFKNLHNKCY